MSTLKASPGPWAAVGPDDNIHIVQASDPDMRVCFMTSNGPARENARLIIASPDLYNALQAASHALKSYRYGNSDPSLAISVADFADAALARARGETS